MMARLADSRVGYFTTQQTDYGRPEQRAQQRTYILRYRLEKKDPSAAISEPVKPIVYYVDPATPNWLKPYIKKGDRGVEAGVRGGRVPQRDHREGRADRRRRIRTGRPRTRAIRWCGGCRRTSRTRRGPT